MDGINREQRNLNKKITRSTKFAYRSGAKTWRYNAKLAALWGGTGAQEY